MNLRSLNGKAKGDQKTMDYGLGSRGSRTQVGPEAVKCGQLNKKTQILDNSSVEILTGWKKT